MTSYLVIDSNFAYIQQKNSPLVLQYILTTSPSTFGKCKEGHIAIMATDFLEGFDMNHRVWKILDTGFMGTTKYHLCKLLEQHYNPSWHDMTAVFEAFRFDTNTNERTHCVVMICEQYVILFFGALVIWMILRTILIYYKHKD